MTKKLFYTTFLGCSLFSNAQTLDSSYGTYGFNFYNPSTTWDKAGDILVESDNSAVVLGNIGPGAKRAIYKVNPEGNLDTSFGNAGIQITQNQSSHYKIIKLNSGKYLTIGNAGYMYSQNFFIEKFNSDGTLDTTFGNGGKIAVNMGYPTTVETIDIAYSAVELSDGKIIICGGAEYGYPKRRACLLKLNQDGSFDTSFGTDGKLYFTLNTGVSQERVSAMHIFVANNKLIVAGIGRITDTTEVTTGPQDIFVVRLNMSGTYDTTFGTNGKLIFNLGNPFEFGNMIQDTNGNFYITGSASVNNISETWVAKINSEGQFVNNFGLNGIVKRKVVNIPDAGSEKSNSIILGNNGIYVGGTFYFTGGYIDNDWMYLTKFNFDGTPDLSFGTNGLFRLPTYNSLRRLSSIQFDNNKRILISGDSSHNDRQFVLARIILNNETLHTSEIIKNQVPAFYPNPATDFLYIDLNTESRLENIALFSMDGKLVKDLEYTRQEGKIKLDLKNCIPGNYLLRMKYDKKEQTIKIIKK
ncbi:T9SS type A sorting domain-containing protein [Chryseobacterium sp.]|uniref:T9SS type A sorting domain-containing protein n=1 Tax=Chryseobacterium sp. TaxID=1871047 RepID=UPI002897659F|nr:T9SS type A sorting domain-containing protein [Chryseobacterium sp.]